MVDDALDDGVRIAELVASEITGHTDAPYADLAVADADPDVQPTADGARAYDVTDADGVLATVFVHQERAHVEFRRGLDAARTAADDCGLRVRPAATEPPRLLVFVENGAEAKRVPGVLAAAATTVHDE